MKKTIIALSIVALAYASATPAFANNGKDKNKDENRGLKLGQVIREFKNFDLDDRGLTASQFVLTGTIGSVTSASFVVNVNGAVHVPNLTNSLATVNVDANTKYRSNKDQTLVFADVKTGQRVLVSGNVSGSTLTATKVHILENISNQFSLTGTVGSLTSGSVVVNTITNSKNLPTGITTLATVNVNADTKYKTARNETVTFADVKVGQIVTVQGTVSGSTLTAKSLQIKLPKGKVYGEVTAKTATSVTVKNTVTGVTQTINTDADTKVKINGEVKTVVDVQVGDKGFVKFKTRLAGMFAKVINLFR